VKLMKSVLATSLAVGICGLLSPANADVFNPRFPVTELHAVGAGGTAGSLAACAVMGAQGFSNAAPPPSFETFITSSCNAKTKTLPGPLSMWPGTCNPDGMSLALNAFTPGAHWITATFPAANQAAALNETVKSLQAYGSPAVVPIYGQADHFVAVIQITATSTGVGTWNITQVKAFDGGPPTGFDSGGTNYYSGLQTWGGIPWKNTFYLVVQAINPVCDGLVPNGCGAAPFLDRFAYNYVLMYEPPLTRGPVSASVAPFNATFEKSPSLILPGFGTMSAKVAQTRVAEALIAAGIDEDPEIWDVASRGLPGTAHRVDAVWPDGSPWNYYVVPLLTSDNVAVAFVELDADDGSFQAIQVPSNPVAYTPVSMANAEVIARGALARGEQLAAGKLTWDPRSGGKLAKSPGAPYYQFGIAGATSKTAAIRVTLQGGTVERIL
jgi:hypothetical protein